MLYIGIDTGVNTGVAVWNSLSREFVLIGTMKIHEAMKEVLEYSRKSPVAVIFEDARLRKWIPREKNLSQFRGRAMGAGSVKRDAGIWEDFLKDINIPYERRAPQKGMTKWTENEFRRLTKWTKRTSNHARDAAMLVFGR